MSVVAHAVEAVEGDQFPEVYQAVVPVVAAHDLVVWAWLSVVAKVIKAAINATHNFVNLKFELRWMFFMLLISHFFHRIQTTLTTAIKTEAAQLKSFRIYSHNHNLLLFLQKARTLL